MSQSGPLIVWYIFLLQYLWKTGGGSWISKEMKNATNIILYWTFCYVYWNNLTLFISLPMCFLVDMVQSSTLIFCFTNAKRMWLRKQAKLRENCTLLIYWMCFFGSVCEWINFALGLCTPCSALVRRVICRTLQSGCCLKLKGLGTLSQVRWLPEKAKLRNTLGLSQHCPVSARKATWGAGLWKRSSISAASVQYRHPAPSPAARSWDCHQSQVLAELPRWVNRSLE